MRTALRNAAENPRKLRQVIARQRRMIDGGYHLLLR
jgi:hypothetical protein